MLLVSIQQHRDILLLQHSTLWEAGSTFDNTTIRLMARRDTSGGMLEAAIGDGSDEGDNAGRDEGNNACYDVRTQPITYLLAWSWPFRCVITYFKF